MISNNIVLGETAFPLTPILIQNQNHFFKRLLRASLHSYGFRSIADCEDLEGLLTRSLALRPKVVIIDWQIDDYERPLLIKEIRKGNIRGLRADCGIIISSTIKSKEEVEMILAQPIDGLMLTPYSTKLIGRYVMRAAEMVAKRDATVHSEPMPEISTPLARFNRR